MIGKVFNRLTIIGPSGRDKRGERLWECECSCGNVCLAKMCHLVGGYKKSCGCLKSEILTERNKERATGNVNEHYLYRTLTDMKQRCYNKRNKFYRCYGGRGIKICDRWLEPRGQGFWNFLEDMGDRPEGYSIDRRDNNGDYCPENCRWATPKEQVSNRGGY